MKSIKTKLIIYFCTLILFTTLIISFLAYNSGLNGMQELEEELLREKLMGDIASSTFYLQQYFGNVEYENGQLIDAKGNNIEGNNEMVDAILKDMGSAATIFAKSDDDFKRIATNIMGEDGQRAVGTYLGKDSLAYGDVAQGKQFVGEAMILDNAYMTVYKPINDESGNTIGILFLGVPRERSNQLIQGHINGLRNGLSMVTVIGLIIGIIFVYTIAKKIADPIAILALEIEKISNYDLYFDENSKTKKYLNNKDEIGTITRALDVMQRNLIDLVKDISGTAQQVAASAEELTATSQQSATAADEVAKTIEEIAEGANDQAKDTEKGVEHVNELGELIEKDQQYIKDLNISANEATKLKDEGFKILKDLVEKTKINSESTEEVYTIIVNTNESAEKIENASQMIRSIAEQTNLLALNAAIEAARAGDAGRGFAVVAEEIRKLAEQSNSFTKEIAGIIKELTDKTGHAVDTIQEVEKVTASQTESVQFTNDKFKGINGAIEKMKEIITEINQSSEKMGGKKNQIIEIIENLSAISQENAAGTEEASASVEEQTASMGEIANASDSLARLAEEMQGAIAKFKY
ncbi:methyl-accepting chemotaxis sensory transducer [Alkaliphilus metalliredigens QYMF]|uniref:Methyl-accepting chemotaxis sensory transducer n=1 Tax=Alkaliphilus metalliredigens (strain QYMF) TaxID=293826 RepID=A6TKU1_ALKMQ|nr:methyl-accepting chemotaxis protein [Alkaliphilus metalliredigens]ABR46809.1 methyl-accepting chemotaxis sensory transducer [Alkaliphilus metalliredigens QYMF]